MSHVNLVTESPGPSVAYVRRGSARVPAVARPQCRTCSSPRRAHIERMVLDGLSPAQIARRFDDDLSPQSIQRHVQRGHLPVDNRAVQRHLRTRADERQAEVDAATRWTIEQSETAQEHLSAGARLLARGHLRFTARDVLAAARLLDNIDRRAQEEERQERRVEHLGRKLARLFEIVGEVAGDEVRNDIVWAAMTDDLVGKFVSETHGLMEIRDAARQSRQDRTENRPWKERRCA